jgi:hypothetical protein
MEAAQWTTAKDVSLLRQLNISVDLMLYMIPQQDAQNAS